jgi:transposase
MRDTIDMARESGIHTAKLLHAYGNNKKALCHSEIEDLRQIERFAELVRADEREACAKLCETLVMGKHCAAAIRARGNT